MLLFNSCVTSRSPIQGSAVFLTVGMEQKSAGLLPDGRFVSPHAEGTQMAAWLVVMQNGEVRDHPSGWVLSG